MATLAPTLQSLLKSITPGPLGQKQLNSIVQETLQRSNDKVCQENRKSQWEYLLRKEIFALAATEGKALKDSETNYYDELREALDLILTFTENDACEVTFPLTILQDLLETQTIKSCSHIFSWIESRAARLTRGMVPQKGKALILLRTLNDLLRRLSKMGSTTIFCGRILTFLSGVFPLGERSGVNLRGEYGPAWEGVKVAEKVETKEDISMANVSEDFPKKSDETEVNMMEVDDTRTTPPVAVVNAKSDFYNIFWSLQHPFSKPPLFSQPATFAEFRDAVNKVLPSIKEATTKERAMMGSRSSETTGSLKRKREDDASEESSSNEYFFAKFLTNPDLLDLEIADTHFRRQFLFQLLILLNHLLNFTKAAKSTWATPRNRSLQMDFLLDGADEQWVMENINKSTDELRATAPYGPTFKETVNIILEREKNWIKWKNDLCTPFDREPWGLAVEGTDTKLGLEEATKEARQKMMEPPEDWKWNLGSESLTDIWALGYRDLGDLQSPFQPGSVKDFVKKIKLEDARIDQRKKVLTQQTERMTLARAKAQAAAAAAASPAPPTTLSPLKEAMLEVPKTEPTGTLLSGGRSPLHPSLPPKPGTPSPSKPPSIPLPEVKLMVPDAQTSAPPSLPAPVAIAPLPADDQINRLEESKQRWSWLGLRMARDQHLQHFGKIGTGELDLLQKEIELGIEKEKQESEKAQKGDDPSSGANHLGVASAVAGFEEQRGTSPLVTNGADGRADKMMDMEEVQKTAAEGDAGVKMEL